GSAGERRDDVDERALEVVGTLCLPEPRDEVAEAGVAIGLEVPADGCGVAVERPPGGAAGEHALPEGHRDRIGRAAVRGETLAQEVDEWAQLLRREVDRVPTVAEPRGPVDRRPGVPRDPDRGMGVLRWPGTRPHRREAIVSALVARL